MEVQQNLHRRPSAPSVAAHGIRTAVYLRLSLLYRIVCSGTVNTTRHAPEIEQRRLWPLLATHFDMREGARKK